MRIDRWADIPGSATLTLDQVSEATREALRRFRGPDPDDVQDQVVVRFLSSGYRDPGNVAGHPDTWTPPEGDEQRLIAGADLHLGCGTSEPIPLSFATWEVLERDPAVTAAIADAELEEPACCR